MAPDVTVQVTQISLAPAAGPHLASDLKYLHALWWYQESGVTDINPDPGCNRAMNKNTLKAD